jgi:hypothetical protein
LAPYGVRSLCHTGTLHHVCRRNSPGTLAPSHIRLFRS